MLTLDVAYFLSWKIIKLKNMGIKESAHALWVYINYRHPRFCGINVRGIINNLLFLKKDLYYVKRFKWWGKFHRNTFFFMIDPELCHHPGLADRLKAIVRCYGVAKKNGYHFKIVYKHPFHLEDYLQPNKVDWVADFSDMNYDVFGTKFYRETRQNKKLTLKQNKEYHCHTYMGDLLPECFEDTGYHWADLFDELFRPSEDVTKLYKETGFEQGSYVAVHFRFVNALENFEANYDNALKTQEEKDNLIKRCKDALMKVYESNNHQQVLVFSDSKVFLDSIQDLPVSSLDSSNIGHISFNDNKSSIIKTLLDMFMISRASKVYVVHAPELYNSSCFALVGARIGNIDAEVINI